MMLLNFKEIHRIKFLVFNTVFSYEMINERTKFVYNKLIKTDQEKGPPPADVTLAKGPVHIVVSRDFVNYVINDVRAKTFFDWTRDTRKKQLDETMIIM